MKFDAKACKEVRMEAIRHVAKHEIGQLDKVQNVKNKTKNQDYSDFIKDGIDLKNCEVETALYFYSMYPCLQYNIKSYTDLINEKVIGQQKAVERIVYASYFNQYLNFVEDYTGTKFGKRKSMFLIAPTGCGKSTMLMALEEVFDVPVHRANITSVTSAGYVGENVEAMLLGLIDKAKGDVEKAERGILLIDEIDKRIASDTNDKDVSGKAVQQELLKFFDRGTINVPKSRNGLAGTIEFNTGMLTIIFAGACVGLNEIRDKRLGSKKVGFITSENNDSKSLEYSQEDLIEYGFIPELIGRIDIIEEFHRLSHQNIIDIIYAKYSSMQEHVKILESLGVENIVIDGALWEKVADVVEKSNIGVRELNNIIGKLFYPIMYEAFQHTSTGTCTIDEYGNYTLTYKKEKKEYKGRGFDFTETFDD